jgi:multidrug efflux pump
VPSRHQRALSTLGSSYVNDFPNAGPLQRVVVQADAPARMQPEDLLRAQRAQQRRPAGAAVGLRQQRWITGPMQTVRYNGYPAMRIAGEPARASTGAAMAEMERLAAQLPAGFGYEDRPVARGKAVRLAGLHPVRLLAAGGVPVPGRAVRELVIPLSVMLVVPLGVLGVLLGASCAGCPTTCTSRSA